ncbi:hypothetical protein [Siphonobacter sp. BAB-5385]|uniref:hypothetical protein n=1 Tax=Siphonobacter sp. BAB-5385 TaxID=1864822 RepID=UPI00159565B7|nr:hypothetical protein [Siphonobacter sp. BAB-5385]
MESGLLNEESLQEQFKASFTFENNHLKLVDPSFDERLAQILADFLRKKLLAEKKKFSFETVFSHESKLDIMRKAAEQGYKVYLYFVSTEDYQINQFRVENRVKQGGHDVPVDKIKSRYDRSLGLLHEAAQLTYQTFFFDNSVDRDTDSFEPFLSFKVENGRKVWSNSDPDPNNLPLWFIKYYLNQIQE